MKKLLLFLVVILVTVSCSTIKHSYPQSVEFNKDGVSVQEIVDVYYQGNNKYAFLTEPKMHNYDTTRPKMQIFVESDELISGSVSNVYIFQEELPGKMYADISCSEDGKCMMVIHLLPGYVIK